MIALAIPAMLVGCAQERVVGTLPPPLLRIQPKTAQTPPPAPQPKYTLPTQMPVTGYLNATVVIDPGHGGQDPGTLGNGYVYSSEKNINLEIARELFRILKSRGANVVMTRSGDWFLELDDRANIAERSQADLFVSIHVDASKNRSASGSTVYIGRNASGRSQQIGQAICNSIENSGIECRGLRRAGYRVLVHNSRPAILIECGFLTNYQDAQLLATPAWQQRFAYAVAQGIISTLGR
jgi:N-acetylmuramoyl-L-alanine amidase